MAFAVEVIHFVVVTLLHYSNAQKKKDEAKLLHYHQIQRCFVVVGNAESNQKRVEVEEGNAYSFVVVAVVERMGGKTTFLERIGGIR